MDDGRLSIPDKLGCGLAAFVAWLVGPFGFWILGSGFAGQLVFWPSFDSDPGSILLTLVWLVLFYGPVLLVAVWLGRRVLKSRKVNSDTDA